MLRAPPCVTAAGDRFEKKGKFNKKWPDLFSLNGGILCCFPVPPHLVTWALIEQALSMQTGKRGHSHPSKKSQFGTLEKIVGKHF